MSGLGGSSTGGGGGSTRDLHRIDTGDTGLLGLGLERLGVENDSPEQNPAAESGTGTSNSNGAAAAASGASQESPIQKKKSRYEGLALTLSPNNKKPARMSLRSPISSDEEEENDKFNNIAVGGTAAANAAAPTSGPLDDNDDRLMGQLELSDSENPYVDGNSVTDAAGAPESFPRHSSDDDETASTDGADAAPVGGVPPASQTQEQKQKQLQKQKMMSAMTPVSRILSQRRSQMFGQEGPLVNGGPSSGPSVRASPTPVRLFVLRISNFC